MERDYLKLTAKDPAVNFAVRAILKNRMAVYDYEKEAWDVKYFLSAKAELDEKFPNGKWESENGSLDAIRVD